MYVKFLCFYVEFHGNWHFEAPKIRSSAHKHTIIDGENASQYRFKLQFVIQFVGSVV